MDTKLKTRYDIQYVSDLHLEAHSLDDNELKWWADVIIPSAKYLVLAGDISPYDSPYLPLFLTWCKERFQKVIYVPGNHDYWSSNLSLKNLESIDLLMGNLCDSLGIIFGQKAVIKLDDQTPLILACTLWSPTPFFQCITLKEKNDYLHIKDFNIKAEQKINRDHVKFLEDHSEIQNGDDPIIVITHFSPSSVGTQPEEHAYRENKFFYVNDLNYLFSNKLIWIFGHTHLPLNFIKENTRLLSNPIGIPKENLPYNKQALI